MPIEPVTLSIAIFGAVLSVLNTWKVFDRDRLKLRVVPKFFVHTDDNGVLTADDEPPVDSILRAMNPNIVLKNLCIEVTNLSNFPVIVSEVGFLMKKGIDRHLLRDYHTSSGDRLPVRLEPHTSIVFFTIPSPEAAAFNRNYRYAYAASASGIHFKGSGPALKTLARRPLPDK